MDKYFRVVTLAKTQRPQWLMWMASHQDYCENAVIEEIENGFDKLPVTEISAGQRLIKNCVKYGHFGVIEHPSITLNCCYFPHDVIVQARTHRVGVSFDVQSSRYTSQRIIEVAKNKRDLESVFYFRPVGKYSDREGNKYDYTQENKEDDISQTLSNVYLYQKKLESSYAPEHARQTLFQNLRQHFVVSFNARSLMHFLDLRSKKDAQLEIQQLCDLLFVEFKNWCPELASYYEEKRLHKAQLAP